MNKLRDGLRLLNVADPCVEIVSSNTGELIIAACGEVHMQKCLDDLKKNYAKCKVRVENFLSLAYENSNFFLV